MEEKFIGLVVYKKRYNENSFLLGIICENSIYKKGWNNDCANIYIGQKIEVKIYNKNSVNSFYIIDSETDINILFWNDLVKLQILNEVLNLASSLPENIYFDGLYENLALTFKKLIKEPDSALIFWKNYLEKNIH